MEDVGQWNLQRFLWFVKPGEINTTPSFGVKNVPTQSGDPVCDACRVFEGK